MPASARIAPRQERKRHARCMALALAAVLAASACSQPSPSTGVTAAGLLALAAEADGAMLEGWAGSDRDGVPVDLPKGDTTWFSVGRANVLAATLADGLATSNPLRLGKPLTWRFVDAKDESGRAPDGQAYFGTWDPSGGLIAELTGDIASGDGVSLVLIDPSVATAFEIRIDRTVLAAPPAWVAADRLVLMTGDASAPTSVIVDTSNGESATGPGGARFAVTSGNLARVATMAGSGAPIVIRDLAGWLAGDSSTLGSVEPPDGASTAVSFALDTSGQRLAIAWVKKDGTVRLAVYDGRSNWRLTAEPKLGKARGAAVAWQR